MTKADNKSKHNNLHVVSDLSQCSVGVHVVVSIVSAETLLHTEPPVVLR